MYKFVSPEGKVVKTNSIKKFAEENNLYYVSAKRLSCGMSWQVNGWHSTHPKAKKKLKRFLTKLYNVNTGQEVMLGKPITRFAREHGLNVTMLTQLMNGHLKCYRGWMLKTTHDIVSTHLADRNF